MKLEGVTLKAAVALIADVPHQHEWIDAMDESRVLVVISPVEQINYTLSKAPWPVALYPAPDHVQPRLNNRRSPGP